MKYALYVTLIGQVVINSSFASTREETAATTMSKALEQIASLQDVTPAVRSLYDMDSDLALEGYKQIVQTSPTLFHDQNVQYYAVNTLIYHGVGQSGSPVLIRFLKELESVPRLAPFIRETLYGVTPGHDPLEVKDASKILRSETASLPEKTEMFAKLQHHPNVVRENLDIVRDKAITPGTEIMNRGSAIRSLVNADDWEFLAANYDRTDEFGKTEIIKAMSEFVISKGFPLGIKDPRQREVLSEMFRKSALDDADPLRQNVSVTALGYLVSRAPLETSVRDDVSTQTIEVLKKVRTDAASEQARDVSGMILDKLPAEALDD